MARTFTNDFSWSKSRHEKFSECLRAYYFHYYFSWGGWEAGAPPGAAEAWRLKKLTNRYAWIGTVVHDAIRDVLLNLQAGREVTLRATLDTARARMRAEFRSSRDLAHRTARGRRIFSGLVEHEYGEPVEDAEWRAGWEQAAEALTWFFEESGWITLARGLRPEQWIEVDQGLEGGTFQLEGVKVFAIPDFVYRADGGHLVVVDWKTGKGRGGYDTQVLGYALYLSHRYGVDVTSVEAKLVYLNGGEEVSVRVDSEAIASFEKHFQESVSGMRALLRDVDANTPREADAFPTIEEGEACARCTFRRLCGRTGREAEVPSRQVG